MIFRAVGFMGENRRISPRLFSDNQAQLAQDAYLFDGTIKAFKGLETKYTLASAGTKKSIYRWGADQGAPASGKWFESQNIINYVPGPIAGNTSERTYFTGEDYPRVTDATIAAGAAPWPSVSYKLGIPAPASAPTFVVGGGAPVDVGLIESRYYVITYVSVFGEEGPPSSPTAVIAVGDTQTVTLNDIVGAPTGNYNIQKVRIYRTNTSNLGTAAFQYVDEVNIGTATYLDTIASTALGEVLLSTDWTAPPDAMIGITGLHGGMVAGFYGSDVYICEPYLPHAYPQKYSLTTEKPVVGLGHWDQTIVMLTEGHPEIATGFHPESMTKEVIRNGQSCLSARGIVSLSGLGVLYPSPDGLYFIGQGGPRLVTENVISKRNWEALSPETLIAFEYDFRYYGFYDTGTVQKGFIFDVRQPDAGFITLNFHPDAGYRDPITDTLYLLSGNNIQAFDSNAAALRTFTWRSKEYVSPSLVSMAGAQVVCETYADITFKLYADGVLVYTKAVTSRDPFTLPATVLANVFEIEVTGTDVVNDLAIATSLDELMQVA
jgi:hypothetical protein